MGLDAHLKMFNMYYSSLIYDFLKLKCSSAQIKYSIKIKVIICTNKILNKTVTIYCMFNGN